ncbi:hypothetical protein EIP91_000667 [Steccherinum ochraceum]|uniref:Nuclear segregation protein Bfr1 n=1 Tax=Steccherinum ochraceum TaxID=92696 RepID=A0A4V2MWN8_9APHY|nr:hypothetical protein EIP91_000667 [Steccherinum ochraceum]
MAAADKAKSASTSAAGKKTEPASPRTPQEPTEPASYGSGKPDKAVYDAEQAKLKADIDALQVKVSAVKEKIGSAGKGGPGNDRRSQLRAQLDEIRGQQSTTKASRSKIFDQLKLLQDGIQKKIKDLNTARGRISYKSVQEVDDRIKQLEKQVEGGNLKLVDEKRALAEISQCKRNRRTVESFQADQDAIEADRAAADELRKQLDDPEAKAASDRYEAIKAELDELKKEGDEAYANRSKLLDERTALQAQLDELYNQKRDSAQRFRDANDRYWAKLHEERAKRAERQRVQKAEEEAEKKKAIVERMREEADAPAFQTQIEDCQTLIDYFLGKVSAPALSTPSERAEVAGVPKLEIRKVEAAEGLVARKKKGEEEEDYFVGSPKSKKGKKNTKPAPAPSEDTSGTLNIPLGTLTALLTLSIPPPTGPSDVPRLVEDLNTKKSWFEANQARVTAENKAKIEADIRRILGTSKSEAKNGVAAVSSPDELSPPNGGAEQPAEPAPTPAATDNPSTAVPSEEVVDKLETVAEQ